MRNQKILFILKKKKLYDEVTSTKTLHSGLFNSATFVDKMLKDNGIDSNLVQVETDENVLVEVVIFSSSS